MIKESSNLRGWEVLAVCHARNKFGDYSHFDIEDLIFATWPQVATCKGLCDFIGGSHSK